MYSPNNLQSNFRKVGGGCYKTQVGNDKYIILQWKQFLFLKRWRIMMFKTMPFLFETESTSFVSFNLFLTL